MKRLTQPIKNSCFLIFLATITSGPKMQAEVVYDLELEVQEVEIGNLLYWQTRLENGSESFHVEMSINGFDFQDIGEIPAAGQSSQMKKYRFFDTSIGHQKLYYRLKLLEKEGQSSYSRTVVLHKRLSNQFMIVYMDETQSSNWINISLDVLDKGRMSYTIDNLKGTVIRQKEFDVSSGINPVRIDLNQEATGNYRISFQLAEERESVIVRKIQKKKKQEHYQAQRKTLMDAYKLIVLFLLNNFTT